MKVYLRLWLTYPLLSASCCWSLYLCRSYSCSHQAFVYLEFSFTSFPLSKHTGGGDTIPAFSGWHVYLQFTWEGGLHPLLWSFPPAAPFTSFPVPGCWAGAATPAFSSWLVYLQFHGGYPLPPFFGTQGTPPSLLRVFCCCCCLLFSFFPFSLGWDQSVQGVMLIWPRIVCGSTACHLAHLVVYIFPSGLGAGVWWHGSPPGFSV
jgi:hypothetical protein